MSRLLPSVLAAALAVLAGCRDRPVAGPEPTLPSQTVEGFVLNESASGKRQYTLEAGKAYVYDQQQRVDVTGPTVLFYDENGRVHSVLTADEGTIFSRTEDLVARGHVMVRTEDSTVLATESLAWSNQMHIVRTDAALDISTPRGRITGKGLVSDAALSRIQILSPVNGQSDYDFQTGK